MAGLRTLNKRDLNQSAKRISFEEWCQINRLILFWCVLFDSLTSTFFFFLQATKCDGLFQIILSSMEFESKIAVRKVSFWNRHWRNLLVAIHLLLKFSI